MNEKENALYRITRPGEYVAFITKEVPTHEGSAFIFMACDGYSEYAFHIGVEPDEDPETILKSVYLLMENKDFMKHMHEGFTLVFDRYEELSERIEGIIKHSNGKVIFDKALHHKIASPLLDSLNQSMRKKG